MRGMRVSVREGEWVGMLHPFRGPFGPAAFPRAEPGENTKATIIRTADEDEHVGGDGARRITPRGRGHLLERDASPAGKPAVIHCRPIQNEGTSTQSTHAVHMDSYRMVEENLRPGTRPKTHKRLHAVSALWKGLRSPLTRPTPLLPPPRPSRTTTKQLTALYSRP